MNITRDICIGIVVIVGGAIIVSALRLEKVEQSPPAPIVVSLPSSSPDSVRQADDRVGDLKVRLALAENHLVALKEQHQAENRMATARDREREEDQRHLERRLLLQRSQAEERQRETEAKLAELKDLLGTEQRRRRQAEDQLAARDKVPQVPPVRDAGNVSDDDTGRTTKYYARVTINGGDLIPRK